MCSADQHMQAASYTPGVFLDQQGYMQAQVITDRPITIFTVSAKCLIDNIGCFHTHQPASIPAGFRMKLPVDEIFQEQSATTSTLQSGQSKKLKELGFFFLVYVYTYTHIIHLRVCVYVSIYLLLSSDTTIYRKPVKNRTSNPSFSNGHLLCFSYLPVKSQNTMRDKKGLMSLDWTQ